MQTELATINKNVHEACAFSDFYQLLSISLRYPEKELANALIDGRFESDSQNILKDLSCSNDDIEFLIEKFKQLKLDYSNTDEILKQMRCEHTQLFNGLNSSPLSVYESIFLYNEKKIGEEPMLFVNDTSLDVEKCYKEAGVSIANNNGEPADYIVSELEFLMFLYGNKGKALYERNHEKLHIIE